MNRSRLLRTAVLAVLVVAHAPDAGALVPCGQKVRATGELREGSSIRLRAACRANEVVVDSAVFGGAAGVETLSFTSETTLGGTATLFLTPDGRINSDEYEARTPIGPGTLRSLRCYVTESVGGGGIEVAAGAGACGSALTYTGGPAVAFSGTDVQVMKDSGAATMTIAAGQCVALRVALLGTTSSAYVNCTLERVPG